MIPSDSDQENDDQDVHDLALPLDPKSIFEAAPDQIYTVTFTRRQHELVDAAIGEWINMARLLSTDHGVALHGGNLKAALHQLTAEGWIAKTVSDPNAPPRYRSWIHQQPLMLALFGMGAELRACAEIPLPAILRFLVAMLLDPVQDCNQSLANIIMSTRRYCHRTIELFETAIAKYCSTPLKKEDPTGEAQLATSALSAKKEMCKAMYALIATLNHAVSIRRSFMEEKVRLFFAVYNQWRVTKQNDLESVERFFSEPRKQVKMYSKQSFPPVEFPTEIFKPYFARFCQIFKLPVSLRDLEGLEASRMAPGRKAGYLFRRSKAGEWARHYFYITHPQGMLMQHEKNGKDIQIANLRQALVKPIDMDSRDNVFEVCTIEIYLMECILQALTATEFEEWRVAISAWHQEKQPIEALKISAPPTKYTFSRQRLLSTRSPDNAPRSPIARPSTEVKRVKCGKLYILDVLTRPTNARNWREIHCCLLANGHFAQFNRTEEDMPFETIELSTTLRTHIAALDTSLFFKKHCFSVRTKHGINYYTVSRKRTPQDQENFVSWFHHLTCFAKAELFGADERMEYRLYRTFWIMVNDGQMTKDLDAYCEIMLDDERRARTSIQARKGDSDPETPFWRDNFRFSGLAAFSNITINVIQVKGSKNVPIGRAFVPVRNMMDQCDEGWYPIVRINESVYPQEHVGDLRLKLLYEEQIVLPLPCYAELLDIILDFKSNDLISRLAEMVLDLESYAKNILNILEGRNLAVKWINSLIDAEIAEAGPNSINVLFRGNTLLTKALDAYMKMTGSEYLEQTLGDIIKDICDRKVECEVDPARLGRNEEMRNQRQILMTYTKKCWQAVQRSADEFPPELRLVFSHLQQCLTEKFSNEQYLFELETSSSSDHLQYKATSGHYDGSSGSSKELPQSGLAKYTGISGFVFLRLICPAILNPKLFYIAREHPEKKTNRTLTLIAKSLQGLANLVMFGIKENFMFFMNDFIVDNMENLKAFIDNICTAQPPIVPGPKAATKVGSSSNSTHSIHSVQSMFRAMGKNGSASHGNGSNNGHESSGSSHVGQHQQISPTSPTAINLGGAGMDYHHYHAHSTKSSSIAIGNSDQQQQTPPSSYPNQHQYQQQTLLNGSDNGDVPLLPYMIDLSKELASFSTTVARAVPRYPNHHHSRRSSRPPPPPTVVSGTSASKSAGSESGTGGPGSDPRNGNSHGRPDSYISDVSELSCQSSPSMDSSIYSSNAEGGLGGGGNESTSDSGAAGGGGPGGENGEDDDFDTNDIVYIVGQLCWQLLEDIRVRVQCSVEREQEEQQWMMLNQMSLENGGGVYPHPVGGGGKGTASCGSSQYRAGMAGMAAGGSGNGVVAGGVGGSYPPHGYPNMAMTMSSAAGSKSALGGGGPGVQNGGVIGGSHSAHPMNHHHSTTPEDEEYIEYYDELEYCEHEYLELEHG